MSEWISVEDDPPQKYQQVFMTDGERVWCGTAFKTKKKWIDFSCKTHRQFTHWIPIPKLPRRFQEWVDVEEISLGEYSRRIMDEMKVGIRNE